ncbi:hypothetical protein KY342_05890 [Candidatus Woesearchaeota archaeon]|nr:hypothetical protein [Candidatus Woesearchaeota archaeon]
MAKKASGDKGNYSKQKPQESGNHVLDTNGEMPDVLTDYLKRMGEVYNEGMREIENAGKSFHDRMHRLIFEFPQIMTKAFAQKEAQIQTLANQVELKAQLVTQEIKEFDDGRKKYIQEKILPAVKKAVNEELAKEKTKYEPLKQLVEGANSSVSALESRVATKEELEEIRTYARQEIKKVVENSPKVVADYLKSNEGQEMLPKLFSTYLNSPEGSMLLTKFFGENLKSPAVKKYIESVVAKAVKTEIPRTQEKTQPEKPEPAPQSTPQPAPEQPEKTSEEPESKKPENKEPDTKKKTENEHGHLADMLGDLVPEDEEKDKSDS